jgi:hypothetical protein
MKERVKDNLHDLENTSTTNKTSSKKKFNTQKTKFFEKVKRKLIGNMPTFTTFDVH